MPDGLSRPQPSTDALRTKALLAGICSLILTVGLSRFAYTPMLPVMQAQTWLDDVAGGWLAAINYAGYMFGALTAAAIPSLRLKFLLYRIGLVVAVVSTIGMGLTEKALAWALLRFLGGLGSTAGMLLASGLILNWLLRTARRPELGLHFAGMGLGILVSGLAAVSMSSLLDWSSQWAVLGLLGLVFFYPAWAWLPAPESAPITPSASLNEAIGRAGRSLRGATPCNTLTSTPAAAAATPDAAMAAAAHRRWLRWAALAYVCAGFGYVISATFLVAIVEALPAMHGQGAAAWIVVGVAAAPATFVWDGIARRLGETPALLLAYALQIVSIVLPTATDAPIPTMTAAALYGITFMGIVSMSLSNVGRRSPGNPAKAMARLTLGYGSAQIVAPALTGYLVARSGTYDSSLLLAAAVMLVGMFCLWRSGAQLRARTEPSARARL